MVYAALLSIFLVEEHFLSFFFQASLRTESSIYLYMFEDWKNYQQTTFWLCPFQALFPSHSPNASSAKCCRITAFHDTVCGYASSCHRRWQKYSWKAYLHEDGKQQRNYRLHKDIPLNSKSTYPQLSFPLSGSKKFLQSLQGPPTPREL